MSSSFSRRLDALALAGADCLGCLQKGYQEAQARADGSYYETWARIGASIARMRLEHGLPPTRPPQSEEQLRQEQVEEDANRAAASLEVPKWQARITAYKRSVAPSKRRLTCYRCASYHQIPALAARIGRNMALRDALEEERKRFESGHLEHSTDDPPSDPESTPEE